ncbi:MAG: reprolysin-like metallopeptidase [Pseudomonadota bacterium]
MFRIRRTTAMMPRRPSKRWSPLWLAPVFLLAACGGGGGGSGGGGSEGNGNNTNVQNTGTNTGSNTGNTSTGNTSNPPEPLPPAPAAPVEIKLLALYSPGVADQFSDPVLRIQHITNVANDVVDNSGGDFQFSLVATHVVEYPDDLPVDQALDDVTYNHHPAFASVPALRDSYQADVVVLVRPYANDGRCGLAWIGGYQQNGNFSNPAEADFAFSVVGSNCSDYTLLHELGHNLGLAHSRRESPDGGTYPYAVGHGEDNKFVTIMASTGEYNAPRLPLLSSPAIQCDGSPCGIDYQQPNGADAVQALSVTARQVAGYR